MFCNLLFKKSGLEMYLFFSFFSFGDITDNIQKSGFTFEINNSAAYFDRDGNVVAGDVGRFE